MRKKRAIRRRVTPDPKFGDELISRFVNSVLQDGKKNIARTIVYSALEQIGQKTDKNPLDIFKKAVDVNGPMIITTSPASPQSAWFAVAAWESENSNADSIGVASGYFGANIQKLGAYSGTSNRKPDVSQGTSASGIGFHMRFWAAWEANVSGKWQLYASNILILIDDVPESNVTPTIFKLDQNYPNPFNPTTNITFTIPYSSFVVLKVYDVLGREVATVVNEVLQPGEHLVVFDGTNLSSGVYFNRLQTNGFVLTKMMILVR